MSDPIIHRPQFVKQVFPNRLSLTSLGVSPYVRGEKDEEQRNEVDYNKRNFTDSSRNDIQNDFFQS